MSAADLCVFLTTYAFVVAAAAVTDQRRWRRSTSWITVVVALIAVVATTVSGFYLKPGDNYLSFLWFLVGERDLSALVASCLGVTAGLVWFARLTDEGRQASDLPRRRSLRRGITLTLLVVSLAGVVFCGQVFIWKEIGGIRNDPASRVHEPGFVVEKIAKLDYPPIRIAVGDTGKVYVSYDYFDDSGTMGGGIVELAPDASGDKYEKKIVADSPFLMRCYGLAARGDALFVSRSGFSAKASQGVITYENAGAVTRLRDIDRDGYFEFADDIVTDLPGARGPDTMQQNNGICFADDGSLYVTCASATDRGLDSHPWAGSVLRIDPDSLQPEVFARGFRNPFGIVFGPDGELFVADNDVNRNPGDEINHVVRGAHYGHPFVVPGDAANKSSGFRAPIFVGEPDWNFLGMAHATSATLPENCRNCLYIADFMQHAILRVQIESQEDSFCVASIDRFATISSPLDIAVTESGEFFVISRYTKNVYRIRPLRPRSNQSLGMGIGNVIKEGGN